MTPREVVAIRTRLGMTRAAFAELTRLGGASLARWEKGLLIQNAANDQLLYLLRFPENVKHAAVRRSGPTARLASLSPRTGRLLRPTSPPRRRRRSAASRGGRPSLAMLVLGNTPSRNGPTRSAAIEGELAGDLAASYR